MIYGVFGEIGSGKSLLLLDKGVEFASKYNKFLVANFPLNLPALWDFAVLTGQHRLLHLIKYGGIVYVPDFKSSLGFQRSVVLFDEAGIFMNARTFQSNSREFLMQCAEVRKHGNDLFLAAQFYEQIDSQLRNFIQVCYQCDSLQRISKDGRAKIVLRSYYAMRASSFKEFQSSTKKRFVQARIGRGSLDWKMLPFRLREYLLFQCFNSYARLQDNQDASPQHYIRAAVDPKCFDRYIVPGPGDSLYHISAYSGSYFDGSDFQYLLSLPFPVARRILSGFHCSKLPPILRCFGKKFRSFPPANEIVKDRSYSRLVSMKTQRKLSSLGDLPVGDGILEILDKLKSVTGY